MDKKQIYKDSTCPVAQRIEDLLMKMTIEEKVNQLLTELPMENNPWVIRRNGEAVISKATKAIVSDPPCGQIGLFLRSDPYITTSQEQVSTPEEGANLTNEMHKYIKDNTRLGIPPLVGNDNNHCHLGYGGTIFPSVFNMGCTWNQKLQQMIGESIALESRSRGETIAYAPDLDVVRDPRYGRSDQNYGEDPYLAAQMGVAMVKGLQGEKLGPKSVVALLRVYPGVGETEGGHDFDEINQGKINMQEVVLYPWREAVKAGSEGIMVERSVYDGIPAISSRYYLTELLREQWGFKGITLTDASGIQFLSSPTGARVAKDNMDASILALKAGLDQSFSEELVRERLTGDTSRRAYANLIEAVNIGLIDIKYINIAVRRVLRLKFKLGLFEATFVDPEYAKASNRCKKHLELAEQSAKESIVLLENKNNILPLSKKIKSIAVIGPNADDEWNQLGDYAPSHEPKVVTTIYDGIRERHPKDTNIEYAKGCSIRNLSTEGFYEAIFAAEQSDMIIAVVGGSSRIIYGKNGENGRRSDDTDCGENVARSSLKFSGVQLDLLKALKATGKPLIVVLIHGRPIAEPWLKENADAIIDAGYPGEAGGIAVAEVLFGDYNPGGKLTMSVPINVGQIPVCYYHRLRMNKEYVENDGKPLYPFGYGLSFTTFEYGEPIINEDHIKINETTQVKIPITNTGNIAGDEVVQLYIRDEIASVCRFNKQLKGFERITLQPGETKTIMFKIGFDQLCFYNANDEWIIEPGEFTLMIGGDSSNHLKTCKLSVD